MPYPAQALATRTRSQKQFALTANPLNFTIGRYGLNFEYQPTLHHGLIVSPHYDHVNADIDGYTTDSNGNINSCKVQQQFLGFRRGDRLPILLGAIRVQMAFSQGPRFSWPRTLRLATCSEAK
jgi:hypothetical protein